MLLTYNLTNAKRCRLSGLKGELCWGFLTALALVDRAVFFKPGPCPIKAGGRRETGGIVKVASKYDCLGN